MNSYLDNARLVIFDLDGVLMNKTPNRFPAALIKEFTTSEVPFAIDSMITFKGNNWIGELEKIGVNVGDRKTLFEISRRLYELNKNEIAAFGWVGQLIPELAKTKKLAILTNNSLLTVSVCLGGLEKYFSAIKTWESVLELKPSPCGILDICRELDIKPSETLMVGDSREDNIAAQAAGVNFVAVSEGECPALDKIKEPNIMKLKLA